MLVISLFFIDFTSSSKTIQKIKPQTDSFADITPVIEPPQITAQTAKQNQPAIKDAPLMKRPAINKPSYLPPIATQPKQPPQYQGNLMDHQAYNAFHQQQQAALEQRFIEASEAKITTLETLLAKGREQGLEQHKLQVAIEKITALKAMQEKLKTAQQ